MGRDTVQILINLVKKGTGAQEAAKELDVADKATKRLNQALAGLATVGTVKAVYAMGELGAESLRTRASFQAISGGASEAEGRLEAMRRATRGAISEQQLMSAASRMMQMGLANNSAELEKMAGMAVRLGGAMGKDAAGAIEEWNLLLANQSIPRLDTFGVSASRVRKRIGELQAATKDMTREEAFLVAVTEEGEASLARLGETVDDEALAFEQMEANVANLKAAFAEQLAPAVAEVTGWLAKQIGMVNDQTRAMQKYEDQLGRDAVVSAYVAAHYQGQANALEDLELAYIEAMNPAQDLMRAQLEAAGALDSATAAAYGTAEASEIAAGAQEGLSISAGRVARSFGEMVFDEETLWNLALASGASVESLSALAQHLGIATDAQIQNALGAHRLIEGYAAGQVTLEELSKGYRNMATETLAAKSALAESQGEIEYMRGGMVDAEDAADIMAKKMVDTTEETEHVGEAAYDTEARMGDLTESLYTSHDAFDQTRDRASRLREALAELRAMAQGTKSAMDNLADAMGGRGAEERQTGGIMQSSMALVGEGGPELAFLGRGTRVIPAWETRQVLRSMADNRQYHHSYGPIVVNDSLAAAMLIEDRKRALERNLRANM